MYQVSRRKANKGCMHTFLILHLTPLDLHASVLGSEEKNMDASMRVTG